MIWDFIFAESFFQIPKRALLVLFETDRVGGEPRIDSGLDGGKPRVTIRRTLGGDSASLLGQLKIRDTALVSLLPEHSHCAQLHFQWGYALRCGLVEDLLGTLVGRSFLASAGLG